MKGFKKFFIVFLNTVFITQFSIIGLFLFPSKARAASPQIINKQVQTLASGEDLIHSTLVVNNMLFAGTRTSPAKIIKWSNLSDLTIYSVNTFANDGAHDRAESMIYDNIHNKVYIAFGTSKIVVIQFDPDTFTFTDVIDDATEDPWDSPAITTDGTYLYIITNASPAKILKYQISDFSKVGSVVINDGVSNKNSGHAIIYDGVNLYATGLGFPGWIAKINPSDLTHTVADFQAEDNSPSDDIADVGDYIYAGLEATTGIVVRVKKSDLSLTRIATGQTTSSYGVYYDGQYVWGVFNASPGNLIRIDPDTLSVDTFVFDSGEDYLNEVVSDGQKLITTCWMSPAKVLRFNIDTTPPAVTITRSPNQNLSNGNYQISVDFDDATTKEYKLDTGEWTAYADVVLVSTEGTHTFDARGTDEASNIGNAIQATFTIDKTPPVLSLTSPISGISTISSTSTVSGTSTDVGSGIATVTVNGTAVSNPASFSQNVNLSFGSNAIAIIATDNAGNSTTQTLTITRNYSFTQNQTPYSLRNNSLTILNLQNILKYCGYFPSYIKSTGYYGWWTKRAVYLYQKAKGIVKSVYSWGAGWFGPKTRQAMNEDIVSGKIPQSILIDPSSNTKVTFSYDLLQGDMGYYVENLQERLSQEGFLNSKYITSYFGSLTRQTVIKYQKAKGIIKSVYSWGAGRVGPKTRAVLNGN